MFYIADYKRPILIYPRINKIFKYVTFIFYAVCSILTSYFIYPLIISTLLVRGSLVNYLRKYLNNKMYSVWIIKIMPIIMPYLEKLLLKHFCRIFLTLKKRKQKRLIKNKKKQRKTPSSKNREIL